MAAHGASTYGKFWAKNLVPTATNRKKGKVIFIMGYLAKSIPSSAILPLDLSPRSIVRKTLPQEADEEVLFVVPVVVEEVRDAVSSVSAVDDDAGGVPDRFRSPAVIDAAAAAVILVWLPSLL